MSPAADALDRRAGESETGQRICSGSLLSNPVDAIRNSIEQEVGGCVDLSSLPHGNRMPPMGDASPFKGKDYPDPNPHSASDDQQHAAYLRHQQEQNDTASKPSEPDMSNMTRTGSSSSSSGPNAGMMTSSTSCHN